MTEKPRSRSPRYSTAQVAQGLKERVYATFTGLSILLVFQVGDHDDSPVTVALSLFVGILGIMAASFASDVIAHLATHKALPARVELAHMMRVPLGGLLTVIAPLMLLTLAAIGWIAAATALTVAIGTYIVTLAVISYLAVRRANLPWPLRLMVLTILTLLGLLVLGLQLLAHS